MSIINSLCAHDRQKDRPARHSRQAGKKPVAQVIPKRIFSLAVRDLERPDSKICHNKELLAQGGISEGKNPAFFLPGHAHHQDGQHHAGQSIAEASRYIPQHVVPLPVRAGIQQPICQASHPNAPLSLPEVLYQKDGEQHPRHVVGSCQGLQITLPLRPFVNGDRNLRHLCPLLDQKGNRVRFRPVI